MTSIVGTLPFTLTNGSLANADEVMADLNFIRNQVNSNAQPGGGASTASIEWTQLTDLGTYVSATSFTVPGDQTSTFQIGRRLKSTNTGGTAYSTIVGASVVLNTTVTVVNTSGTLDAGLTDLYIGTLAAINPSTPSLTNFTTQGSFTTITSASAFLVGSNPADGDILSEWTTAASKFTPKSSGLYRLTLNGHLGTFATTLTIGASLQTYVQVNGATIYTIFGAQQNWPYATGTTTYFWPVNGRVSLPLNAGDYAQVYVQMAGGVSGGNPNLLNVLTWERLPYSP